MTIKTKITPLGAGNKIYPKDFVVFESSTPEHILSKSKKLSLKLLAPVLVAAVAARPENTPGMVRSEVLLLHLRELYN